VARAETYLHAKFHLDPSNRLATVHQRHRNDRQTDRQTNRQRSDSIGRTVLQTVAQKRLKRLDYVIYLRLWAVIGARNVLLDVSSYCCNYTLYVLLNEINDDDDDDDATFKKSQKNSVANVDTNKYKTSRTAKQNFATVISMVSQVGRKLGNE